MYRLAPDWKKAAKNLQGLVTLGAVNCDEDTNRGLCAQYEIKGFPTIKVFQPEKKRDKRTGQLAKRAQGKVAWSNQHDYIYKQEN